MTKIFTYIPLINYTEDSNFFLDLYKLKNDFDYSYFFSEENLPIKTSFWFLRPYTSPQQLKQFFETRTSDILKFFLISSRTDHSFRESDFKNFSTKIFLEAFEYDWEKHQEILNLGFLPILVPSPDEQNQDLTFIFWRKFPTSFTVTQEGPLKDQKIYSYYPKGVFNKFYPYLLNNKQNNSFKIYNKNYFAMNSSSLVSSRRNNNSYRSNNFSDDTTDPVTQLYCRKYGDVTFFG